MFYSNSLSSALCYVCVEKQKIRGIEEGKTPNISVLTGQQGVMALLRLYSFKDDFFFNPVILDFVQLFCRNNQQVMYEL